MHVLLNLRARDGDVALQTSLTCLFLPAVEHEVCVGREVAAGEEELRALVPDVLIRQLLGAHQLRHRLPLRLRLAEVRM